MKLFSSDGSLLMEIKAVKPHADGIAIEGKIMGAMPMKAILTAEEVKAGRKLVSWGVVRQLLRMLVARSKDSRNGGSGSARQ